MSLNSFSAAIVVCGAGRSMPEILNTTQVESTLLNGDYRIGLSRSSKASGAGNELIPFETNA